MELEQEYKSEFNILIKKGRLVGSWANVYEHCKTEAMVAIIISNLLCLSKEDSDVLIKAAILHDWYKKKERKRAAEEGYEAYVKSEKESYEKLIKFGVNKRIVEVAHSVGAHSLLEIKNSRDLVKRIMHFIDDICKGDEIVGIDERIDYLESLEKYKELNNHGKSIHGGLTFFQAQREIGKQIQEQLESIINIEPNTLVSIVKYQYLHIANNIKPELEYTEVNNNLRHYGNMRFLQLTVFLALTGGLITILFSKPDPLQNGMSKSFNQEWYWGLEIVAFILTILFWLMERSSNIKWQAFKTRANQLEIILNYRQLRYSPRIGKYSATNATKCLFLVIGLFWLIMILVQILELIGILSPTR